MLEAILTIVVGAVGIYAAALVSLVIISLVLGW